MDGSLAHVVAGGLAGVTAAVVTAPLEVVKTRLQSSSFRRTLKLPSTYGQLTMLPPGLKPVATAGFHSHAVVPAAVRATAIMSVLWRIGDIRRTEGVPGLFRGISMTMPGVLVARAVYFGAYVNCQELLASYLPRGSHGNHFVAAAFAGFTSQTFTSPFWVVKTRLQLQQSPSSQSPTALRCIRAIWQQSGPLGFYKGIQASYLGIAETALHFVVYEDLKRRLLRRSRGVDSVVVGVSRADEVFYCSIASTCSKSFSTAVCYPHEVLRTRLREEGTKYRGLVQTLRLVIAEEGPRALYRGMLTHFMRQIPNTCIVLTTYEAILWMLREHRSPNALAH